ncbi:hypothetical protein KQI42_14105 [Tissierella sp. MSJ-40]|uniref:Uncharacterized protein n=1 Tax=Tissierella simiarum TaxID=2841534 RepID=A0ABS6E8I5_9FIRM|nr:hypothetical protein [Tissierella simiarum]MBU5439151.1 hypothetical protein [Tissierella simiarum]
MYCIFADLCEVKDYLYIIESENLVSVYSASAKYDIVLLFKAKILEKMIGNQIEK